MSGFESWPTPILRRWLLSAAAGPVIFLIGLTGRIALRDPNHVEAFRTVWIPREEFYFTQCAVRERCDIVLMN